MARGRWQLGETVLQLIISELPSDPIEHYATVVAGFLTVFTLLNGYHLTEPHHGDGHAIRRHTLAGGLHGLLLFYKALSTLLFGVSIKLALYKPILSESDVTDAPYARAHRWLLGGSLVVSIGMQKMMTPLHGASVGSAPAALMWLPH